ncbi:MAG: CHAD domain-containing protein [Pseudomonadota bacterium]
MQEIELKIELDPKSEQRVRRTKWPGTYWSEQPVTRTLRSIYFDTVDQRLASAGMALRLRKAGRSWTQTVKLGHEMNLGLSTADEHSCPAPGGRLVIDSIPDPDVVGRLKEQIHGNALAPVFETQMRRTTRLVRVRDAIIEIAVDVGQITAAEKSEPLRELELELVAGDPRALFELLKHLLPDGGLAISACSKADRGRALANDLIAEVENVPRRATRVEFSPEEPVAEVIKGTLTEVCLQVTANHRLAMIEITPDLLKQLRIGLRRFRSALSLFKRQIGGSKVDHLNEEARWFAGEIAKVRDLDVVLTDILAPERELHEDPGLDALDGELQHRLTVARRRFQPVLAGERVQSFLIDLLAFTMAHPWDRLLDKPIASVGGKMLDRRWRKVTECAVELDRFSIEQRHDLRKLLKKMRYSVEFLRSIYPDEELSPFLKRLKRLQTVFGDLNDAAMLEGMLYGPEAPLADDPQAQRALGRLVGARMARADFAWEKAQTMWDDLVQIPCYWKE